MIFKFLLMPSFALPVHVFVAQTFILYHRLVPDTRVGMTFGHEFTAVTAAVVVLMMRKAKAKRSLT